MAIIRRVLAIHRALAEVRLGFDRANEEARLLLANPSALMVRPDYEQFGWLIERDKHWMPVTSVQWLVVHHDGGPADDNPALAIHRLHRERGWSAIAYHAWIRRDGTIEEGRPLWARGAHASQHNPHSWGVGLAGNLEQSLPTQEQLWSLVSLLRWWLSRRPEAQVVGHRELPGMATACPGQHMDLNWLRRQLSGKEG